MSMKGAIYFQFAWMCINSPRNQPLLSLLPVNGWQIDFDVLDVLIICKVSGQPRQMASTRDMVFSAGTLVAFVSSMMTLEPGDILFTGTSSGVVPLKDGDKVVVEIEGRGHLSNLVRKA